MTSEIKPYAVETLKHNFFHDFLCGDIFNTPNEFIPEFDFLLAGFPCQPFSAGGKRQGFLDSCGTLFFEIERILREKNPSGFILENVEELVKHDLENKNDEIGRTLDTILNSLENDLGYKLSWKVFVSLEFGLPQSRKRIFIVGSKEEKVNLKGHEARFGKLSDVLERGLPTMKTKFADLLLKHFDLKGLHGKSIKDTRGGENNIHSWDIGIKGGVTKQQVQLLNALFKQRRKKQWAEEIGIDWMDGMPLTMNQIASFAEIPENQLKKRCNGQNSGSFFGAFLDRR